MLIRHYVAVKIARSAIKRVNPGKMSLGEERGVEHQQARKEDQCGHTLSAWAVMLQLRHKGILRRLGVKLCNVSRNVQICGTETTEYSEYAFVAKMFKNNFKFPLLFRVNYFEFTFVVYISRCLLNLCRIGYISN